MKITAIECRLIEQTAAQPRFHWRTGLYGDGDGTPPGEKTASALLIVSTDEGITGYAGWQAGYQLADFVRRRLQVFIGDDPLQTERIWYKLWEVDRSEHVNVRLLGLLDIACWDIKSKAADMPLYRLLGGYNDRIPAQASTVTWDTMQEYERYTKYCQQIGFQSFKLHAWGDPKEDAKLCRNLRKWLGDDAQLMYDASAAWDLITAVQFGRVLEDEGFVWYEEPLREADLVSYTRLCADLSIPVLGAEVTEGAHWNAATWIHLNALDMLRTSPYMKCGITGGIKVAHLAECFGLRAQVHGSGFASLNLCAAIPNNDYYEQLVVNQEQIDSLREQGELSIRDGFINAPQQPGILPDAFLHFIDVERQR